MLAKCFGKTGKKTDPEEEEGKTGSKLRSRQHGGAKHPVEGIGDRSRKSQKEKGIGLSLQEHPPPNYLAARPEPEFKVEQVFQGHPHQRKKEQEEEKRTKQEDDSGRREMLDSGSKVNVRAGKDPYSQRKRTNQKEEDGERKKKQEEEEEDMERKKREREERLQRRFDMEVRRVVEEMKKEEEKERKRKEEQAELDRIIAEMKKEEETRRKADFDRILVELKQEVVLKPRIDDRQGTRGHGWQQEMTWIRPKRQPDQDWMRSVNKEPKSSKVEDNDSTIKQSKIEKNLTTTSAATKAVEKSKSSKNKTVSKTSHSIEGNVKN